MTLLLDPTVVHYERALRRAVDIVVSGAALIVLGPVLIAIGAAIRLESRGPALFRQPRLGMDRRCFSLYKFRTMRVGGDDVAHRDLISRELAGEDVSTDGSWKLCDGRITRLGALLRKTSIDELPQLINVFRGDMTLVGPRPCLDWEAAMFPSHFDERFTVPAGVTGLWQVSGRSRMSTLDMLRLDVEYVHSRSIAGDLTILAKTVPALVRGDGAR